MLDATYAKRIRWAFGRTYFLFACGVVTPLTLTLLPRPAHETLGSWYQRGGSVMTVLGLLAQFQVAGISTLLQGGAFSESWEAYRKYRGDQSAANVATLLLAAIGTIIWGYGDLIIKHLKL